MPATVHLNSAAFNESIAVVGHSCHELVLAKSVRTHSLLFCPILFCRIPINLIGFFSMHAKRFSDFHKKNFSTKIDRQNELKS